MKLSKERLRRPVLILLIVAGALVVGAILYGVLNATVGKGEWTLGWSGYQYDDSNYRAGSGTIPTDQVRMISLDWIDGEVEILPCQDTYISITEQSQTQLTEDARVHWSVSEDGERVSIKYRASSWILGAGKKNLEKKLTLRIPERLLAGIGRLEVKTRSADVLVKELTFSEGDFETEGGSLTLSGGSYKMLLVSSVTGRIKLHTAVTEELHVNTKRGDVEWSSECLPKSSFFTSKDGATELFLMEESDFTLNYRTEKGKLSSELSLTRAEGAVGETWVNGTGEHKIVVRTTYGGLRLRKH